MADLSENEALVINQVTADDNDRAPDDAFAARELVEKLFAQLKPQDQLVLRLLDLEQKTIIEISAFTGWSGSLVKVRAFRARRKLRELFQKLQQQESE